jgi:hypothetical protein
MKAKFSENSEENRIDRYFEIVKKLQRDRQMLSLRTSDPLK